MQPSHVFGLNATVDGNISYIDDQTVLYPAGSQLIQYHLEQKTQKFIGLTEGDGISAMQVCPSGSHVAVGMRSIERTPFVVVCDLQNQKRRKVLVVPEGSNAKDFISVCFSNDARLVLAQTGAPDWQIFCWSWEKQKLMSAFKSTSNNNLEIRQMSCNPYDNMTTQICVTGDGIFRSFRQTDGNFKLQFQQKPDKDLLCHSWISESRVVAGTQDAKLLIFDGGDLLLEISHLSSIPHPNPSGPPAAGVSGAPASTTNQASLAIQSSSAPNSSNAAPTLTAFTAIVAFAGGILAGTSAGTCVLFERSDDSSLYRKSKIFATEACAVHSVALCPAEDAAVCTLKNSQVYAVALDADSSKGDEIKCDRLFQPFHHGNVVGMDTCARKPLLATCGTDRSLRIWNYAENSLEVIKYFHDEPLSVALHPSGLYVLVGFSDSLKLMNVLIDDIRPFWESSIRGCRECQFSNGGQYFASVYGSAIGIHSTWTFETIGHLKGHSGKVRSIAWSADDSRIVSCGLDGNIFDWNVKTLKRETEVGFPGTLFSSVGYGGDGKVVYAVGSDGTIKEIADGKLIREFSNKTGYSNLRISRSGKLMFAATNKGAVRMFRLPLPADGSQSDVSEASCHASGITRLRTSFDETYVFSCSEDGCVWVYRALDRDPRGSRREKEWIFSDEILVTKSDLKDTHRLMTELKQKVDALKTDNESHLRLKDLTYAEKLNDLTEKYLLEIDSLKHLTSSLSLERQRNERDHLAEMEGLKAARTAETLEAETAFRAKMRDEEEKYRELSENLREVQEAWEKQMADVESFQSARVQQITEFYKGKLEERQLEMNELRNQLHRRKSEFSQHIQEIEDDADQEILTLSYGFETKLAAEHGALASIRDENNAMHGDYDKLMREISENKSGLNRMYAEDRRLLGIIKGLEKDVLGVKREMQERDDTIQDKEKRISDLKKKNQELEKFKFVLDYKIAELKKQVEPREQDIVLLSKQIKEMDDELHSYHKTHDQLDTQIQDLQMKMHAVEREKEAAAISLKEMHTIRHRIQNELHRVPEVIDNPAELKRFIVSMFHRYQTTLQEPQDRFKQKQAPPAIPLKAEGGHEVDEPLEEELDELRQREHQERTVSTLRHKLAMGEDARYIENVRIMNENVLLLTEINVLRKDLQATQQRTQRLLNSVAKMGGDGKDRDKVVEDIVQELQHGPPVFAASLKQARRSGAGGGGVAESLPFLLPPIKKRQQ